MQDANKTNSTAAGRREKGDSRSGQILIVFVGVLVLLLGLAALMLDGGRAYWEKQRAQHAADAAAIAGAHELRRGHDLTSGDVVDWIKHDAQLHGFEREEITVHYPPVTGSRAGDSSFLEVVVLREMPLSFMSIFGRRSLSVRSRANAGLRVGGDACVIALENDQTKDAFKTNGNPEIDIDCGIMVNSTNSAAMRNLGGGRISATWIGVTGGYSGGGFTSPTPVTGVPPVIDPLAGLEPPSGNAVPNGSTYNAAESSGFAGYVGAAKGGNGNSGNGNSGNGNSGNGNSGNGNSGNGGESSSGGTTTFYNPGSFSDEIKIINGDHFFNPGVYVLERGIRITGGTVNGSEVFFYNVNADGKQFVDIGGNAVVKLTAPTDGTYKGVLFFNNRNAPDRSPGNRIARGNSESYFEGMLYFPSQHLDWAGNPETSAKWSMVVANTINVSGGAGVSVVAPPSISQAPPVYKAVLFE